jgi:succinate-semialdehyde dehydrogenase/glutarate-semialdehyde dehydrogenase
VNVPKGHQPIDGAVPGVRSRGEPAPASTPRELEVLDPTTGSALATVAGGGKKDAARAADAASAALAGWSAAPPALRAQALQRVAGALRDEAEELARLVTLETGKRIAEARAEISFSAEFFEWFAAAGSSLPGEVWEARPGVTHFVAAQPLGLVAVITPWNFPVSIPARKLAPALAAGCTTLFKPSEAAPLSGLRLAELIEQAVPPGVVETVVGPSEEVAAVWFADRRVRGLSFTGSTRVGAAIASQVAARFVRTVLELGGCAPFVVLDDADLDAAAECVAAAKLRNNGQSCIAANTLYAPRRLVSELAGRIETLFASTAVGDPLDEATGLGPTCLPSDPSRLAALVDDARGRGATVIAPAAAPGEGFFVGPALCVQPGPDARMVNEEVFGPVLPVVAYDNVDEAIEAANRSSYGLAAYVFGGDLDAARRVAARLDVGLVGVNTGSPNTPQVPFSPRRDSGLGVEGGRPGLEEFVAYQTVAVTGP